MKLLIKKPEEMTIKVRIPGWSAKSAMKVNGEPVQEIAPGTSALVKRTWKDGDVIDLSLEMRGRIVSLGKLPENIAIMRGPIVLARDSRIGGPEMESVIKPVVEAGSFIRLEKNANTKPGSWMEFTAMFNLESYKEEAAKPAPLLLCDYASAGNAASGKSQFRVWFPQLIDPRRITSR